MGITWLPGIAKAKGEVLRAAAALSSCCIAGSCSLPEWPAALARLVRLEHEAQAQKLLLRLLLQLPNAARGAACCRWRCSAGACTLAGRLSDGLAP